MDIRVNDVNAVQPAEAPKAAAPVDDTFKFTLAAAVDDAELQEKLTNLLNDIATQGKLLSEHMDIRDMKRYRGLVKDFLNEVVNRSHKFSRENSLITPDCFNNAAAALSAPANEPVWEDAADAPAAERPALRAKIGFFLVIREANFLKLDGLAIDSI